MRLNFITILNYLAASSCFAQYSYKRYTASIVQDFIVLNLKVQKIIKIRSAAHIFIPQCLLISFRVTFLDGRVR